MTPNMAKEPTGCRGKLRVWEKRWWPANLRHKIHSVWLPLRGSGSKVVIEKNTNGGKKTSEKTKTFTTTNVTEEKEENLCWGGGGKNGLGKKNTVF